MTHVVDTCPQDVIPVPQLKAHIAPLGQLLYSMLDVLPNFYADARIAIARIPVIVNILM